jgi:hypothetical protein
MENTKMNPVIVFSFSRGLPEAFRFAGGAFATEPEVPYGSYPSHCRE